MAFAIEEMVKLTVRDSWKHYSVISETMWLQMTNFSPDQAIEEKRE